jgi:hypothetical protein
MAPASIASRNKASNWSSSSGVDGRSGVHRFAAKTVDQKTDRQQAAAVCALRT